jgi:hypothetical protein
MHFSFLCAQSLLTTSSVMVAFEFTAQKLHPAAVAAAQVPDTLALMVLAGAFAGSILGSLVLSVRLPIPTWQRCRYRV